MRSSHLLRVLGFTFRILAASFIESVNAARLGAKGSFASVNDFRSLGSYLLWPPSVRKGVRIPCFSHLLRVLSETLRSLAASLIESSFGALSLGRFLFMSLLFYRTCQSWTLKLGL